MSLGAQALALLTSLARQGTGTDTTFPGKLWRQNTVSKDGTWAPQGEGPPCSFLSVKETASQTGVQGCYLQRDKLE